MKIALVGRGVSGKTQLVQGLCRLGGLPDVPIRHIPVKEKTIQVYSFTQSSECWVSRGPCFWQYEVNLAILDASCLRIFVEMGHGEGVLEPLRDIIDERWDEIVRAADACGASVDEKSWIFVRNHLEGAPFFPSESLVPESVERVDVHVPTGRGVKTLLEKIERRLRLLIPREE